MMIHVLCLARPREQERIKVCTDLVLRIADEKWRLAQHAYDHLDVNIRRLDADLRRMEVRDTWRKIAVWRQDCRSSGCFVQPTPLPGGCLLASYFITAAMQCSRSKGHDPWTALVAQEFRIQCIFAKIDTVPGRVFGLPLKSVKVKSSTSSRAFTFHRRPMP